jgi:hypothetical protein
MKGLMAKKVFFLNGTSVTKKTKQYIIAVIIIFVIYLLTMVLIQSPFKAPQYVIAYSTFSRDPVQLVSCALKMNEYETEKQRNIIKRILKYHSSKFQELIGINNNNSSMERYEIVVAISLLAYKNDSKSQSLIRLLFQRIIFELKLRGQRETESYWLQQDVYLNSVNVIINTLWALIVMEGIQGHLWLVNEIEKNNLINDVWANHLISISNILAWASSNPSDEYFKDTYLSRYFDPYWKNRFDGYYKTQYYNKEIPEGSDLDQFRSFWKEISYQLIKVDNNIVPPFYPLGFGMLVQPVPIQDNVQK